MKEASEVKQMTKVNMDKIQRELDSFLLEYPNHNDEIVSDYIDILDNFTRAEKDIFAQKLGY